MTRQGRGWRWAAVLALACAGAAAGEAQQPQPDLIALRGFVELPRDAVEYLAKSVEPLLQTVPAGGSTVRKLLAAQCGDALPPPAMEALANEFKALNPDEVPSSALDTPLKGEISLQVPFCAPVHGTTLVPYTAGSKGIEQAIKFHYPIYGRKTVAETLRLTEKLTDSCRGLKGLSCGKAIRSGDKIALPLWAPWVRGQVKTGATAKDVLDKLTELAPVYKVNIDTNFASSNDSLRYVGALSRSDLATEDRCADPTAEEEKKWPFDIAVLQERFRIARILYEEKHPGERHKSAHVAIIDSGLSEGIYNKLRVAKLFWVNRDEWKELSESPFDGIDGDDNRIVDDVYGIGASRPIEADFLALPGGDEDQRTHGTKVATAVFGGAPMLEMLLAAKEAPPIIISFLRASLQEGPGRIRPDPTFLPEAMKWLKKGNKDVAAINLSLVHPQPPDQTYGALYDDALFVAAAGNDGMRLTDYSYLRTPYPAYEGGMKRYPFITVGAHDRRFAKLSRSNYGAGVDLLAPGCAIPVLDEKGQKVFGIGTSFAAPLVSLAAGTLRSLGIREPKKVRNRIVAATDFNRDLIDKVWSAGTLNIAKAISIFHDIVDVQEEDARDAAEREKQTLYGDLLPDRGRTANQQLALFCNDRKKRSLLNDRRIVKMTRYLDADGNHRLRYIVDDRNSDFTLRVEPCALNPRETTLQIRIKRPGQPDKVETYSIADVAEIVPRAFP